MMKFTVETQKEIDKFCRKRPKLLLTIGVLKGDHVEFSTLDGNGKEIELSFPRYDIGSITKTMTASLLAKNVTEGKLNLDYQLNQYIEGLPERYYPTLRRLATHNSGYAILPHNKIQTIGMLLKMNSKNGFIKNNPYNGVTFSVVKDAIINHAMQDKDYSYTYSNISYGILGYIASACTKETYVEAMNRFLKDELHLTNTWVGSKNTLQGYNAKNEQSPNWLWDDGDLVMAAGAVSSDARDLLTYAKMNMYDERPYFKLCHQKHGGGNKEWDMGLGWRLQRNSGTIWHDGNSGAYGCFAGFDKKSEVACVVLSNYVFAKTQALGFALINQVKNGNL